MKQLHEISWRSQCLSYADFYCSMQDALYKLEADLRALEAAKARLEAAQENTKKAIDAGTRRHRQKVELVEMRAYSAECERWESALYYYMTTALKGVFFVEGVDHTSALEEWHITLEGEGLAMHLGAEELICHIHELRKIMRGEL